VTHPAQINNTPVEVLRAGSDLLILPDGSIMVHNLTPALAEVLRQVLPAETTLQARCEAFRSTPNSPDIHSSL